MSSSISIDSKKSALEQKLEKTASILEKTYPEQTTGAMEDYAKALETLGNTKDYMTEPLIQKLKRLYVLPNRQEHNEMLEDLHNLIEFMYEMRINEHLKKKAKQPKSKTPWAVLAVIAVIYLLK